MNSGIKAGGQFLLTAWRPYGIGRIPGLRQYFFAHGKRYHRIAWQDTAKNIVTNVGLQHILDVVFSSGSAVDPWYVGLMDASPSPAAGDTLATHAGWTEFDEYTGNRQEYVEVRSSQTESNAASPASFAITGAGSGVGGAFLASVSSGTSGTLLCGAALTGGNRTVAASDTVEVTYTFGAQDDGA